MGTEPQRDPPKVGLEAHASGRGPIRRKLDATLGVTIAVLMGVLVLVVLWQVFMRYLGTWLGLHKSAWTEEAARYLLVWMALLGAGYAAGQRMHLAIDLLPSLLAKRFGPGGERALRVTTCVITAIFAVGVLGVGGVMLVHSTLRLEQETAALGMSVGLLYTVLPLSAGIIAFYALAEAWDALRGKMDSDAHREERS